MTNRCPSNVVVNLPHPLGETNTYQLLPRNHGSAHRLSQASSLLQNRDSGKNSEPIVAQPDDGSFALLGVG